VAAEDGEHCRNPSVRLGLHCGQAELGEDRVDVLFHRRVGDEETVGNSCIGAAFRHDSQHFSFPVGQSLQQSVRSGLPTIEQAFHHQRVDDRAPGHHFAQGAEHLVEIPYPVFEQLSHGGSAVVGQLCI
jgi:hypothetical protein